MVNADDDEAANWPPWYALAALALALVAEFVISAVVLIAAYGGHPTTAQANNPTPAVTDVMSGLGEICFVLVAIMLASWGGRLSPGQFALRRPRTSWGLAIALAVVVYVAFLVFAEVWAAAISSHPTEKYLVKDIGAESGAIGAVASCLVVCVIAPFCEEFLFRGLIFGALRNWRGPIVATLLTGVLFGAVHAGSAPVADLVPLAVFGAMLCVLRQRTGSLYPGVVCHSLNNAITLVVTAGWSAAAFAPVLLGSLAAIATVLALAQRGLRLRLV
jgi:membrane protease YdiL (CAAX protease family)